VFRTTDFQERASNTLTVLHQQRSHINGNDSTEREFKPKMLLRGDSDIFY